MLNRLARPEKLLEVEVLKGKGRALLKPVPRKALLVPLVRLAEPLEVKVLKGMELRISIHVHEKINRQLLALLAVIHIVPSLSLLP